MIQENCTGTRHLAGTACLHGVIVLFSILFLCRATRSEEPSPSVQYISYEDARPILEVLGDELPTELLGLTNERLRASWPNWVRQTDYQIRARLAQGDEDTIVNFLAFGTSFTHQPRLTKGQLGVEAEASSLSQKHLQQAAAESAILDARIDDLIRGVVTPSNNERLIFVRGALMKRGYNVTTEGGKAAAKAYLLECFRRVVAEQAKYASRLENAQRASDPTSKFVQSSTLFRDRGLSLDTSLLPDFAIEQTLSAMVKGGFLKSRSITRVAVIGPGLDFTDKDEGYDFYPEQTTQPFAVIDTLLRLGLSSPSGIDVTTLDISPRVNEHVRRIRQRSERGIGYTVELPLSSQAKWTPEAIRYWNQFGDQIGTSAKAINSRGELRNIEVRAVRIRPSVMRKVEPVDLNIVLQTLDLPEAKKFDLVIATNIFVYYDVFQQCLALANVAKMVRPNGFLVTNTALLEWPNSQLHAVDNISVVYTRHGDGGHFVWYQAENPPRTSYLPRIK